MGTHTIACTNVPMGTFARMFRSETLGRVATQVAPGHIGLVIFVATSTPKIVAVLRTLPEIVMSAPDTGGCCPASIASRSLTSWSCSTSCRMASIGMSGTDWDFAVGNGQACPGDNAVHDVFRAVMVQGV